MELSAFIVRVLVGLGSFAAGTGIFIAGLKLGRFFESHMDRVAVALESQASSQREMAGNLAEDLSKQNQIIRLLEDVHEDRREIGVTLRALARKLNQLLADQEAG